MKSPESDGKGDIAAEVARGDFEDFDYYWQHLRRNEGYIMASALILMNEETYRDNPASSIRNRLKYRRLKFHACCLLPKSLSRGIEDSEKALQEVLKSKPDFFQTPEWQSIKAKASAAEPVAFWNLVGPHGCAWRDYYDGEKYEGKVWKDPREDYYKQFAFYKDPHLPDRHDVAREFADLRLNLEITEFEAGNLSHIEYWAKQQGRKVEDERKLNQANYQEARARMKRFLEAHPRMDFVADTRLPWETVSRAMESEWERIKELRRSVGLEPNEQPPRKRDWKKQLEVFDAYFPHWLKHRKKITALPRIWRENLGFQEAFKLLGVELAPNAADLARRMDQQKLKPKGVFKFTDRIRENLEKASYVEVATRGLSDRSKPKRGSASKGDWDDQSQFVPVVEFDYDAVYALLDGGEVAGIEPGTSPEFTGAALDVLLSWRPHFCIPRPPLPVNFAGMSAEKRKKWFRVARERIEALWHSTDCDDLT